MSLTKYRRYNTSTNDNEYYETYPSVGNEFTLYYNLHATRHTKFVDLPTGAATQTMQLGGNDPLNIVLVLNTIQAGTGATQRQGRRVRLISTYVDGTFSPDSTNHTEEQNGTRVRLAVVYDRQVNGVAPINTGVNPADLSTLFSQVDTNGNSFKWEYSPLNRLYDARFIVLHSFLREITPNTDKGTVSANWKAVVLGDGLTQGNRVTFKVDLQGLETIYSADSSPPVLSDISTGALYFIIFTYGNALVDAQIQFVCNARTEFEDIL